MERFEGNPNKQYPDLKTPETTEAEVVESKPTPRQKIAEYTRDLRGRYVIGETEEDQRESDYISSLGPQFTKIIGEKPPESSDISEALAELASDNFQGQANIDSIIANNDIENGVFTKEELDKYKKEQALAKDLFMESARRVFPGATPLGLNSSEDRELSQELGYFYKKFEAIDREVANSSMMSTQEAVAKSVSGYSPRERFGHLGTMIEWSSQVLKQYGRIIGQGGAEEEKELLAEYVKLIYRMELARDILAQKINSDPKIPAGSEKQTETAKDKDEQLESSKKEFLKITESLKRIAISEEQSEAHGKSVYQRTMRPSIDAFRKIYPNEEALNKRLHELLQELDDKIKKANPKDIIGKDKIENEDDYEFIVGFLADRMFSTLSTKEQQALTDEVKIESLRQDLIFKSQGSGGSVSPPPERLLSQLLSKLHASLKK